MRERKIIGIGFSPGKSLTLINKQGFVLFLRTRRVLTPSYPVRGTLLCKKIIKKQGARYMDLKTPKSRKAPTNMNEKKKKK